MELPDTVDHVDFTTLEDNLFVIENDFHMQILSSSPENELESEKRVKRIKVEHSPTEFDGLIDFSASSEHSYPYQSDSLSEDMFQLLELPTSASLSTACAKNTIHEQHCSTFPSTGIIFVK